MPANKLVAGMKSYFRAPAWPAPTFNIEKAPFIRGFFMWRAVVDWALLSALPDMIFMSRATRVTVSAYPPLPGGGGCWDRQWLPSIHPYYRGRDGSFV